MTDPRSHPACEQEARERVRAAEDAWNLHDVDAVVMAHRIDCQWRAGSEFLWGREQIRGFLDRKWKREIDFRVIQQLWAFTRDRLAVRLAWEFRTDGGAWFRGYGDESWEYDAAGLVSRRFSSCSEHLIAEHERLLRWPVGARGFGGASLEELGL
ncbi:DUF1348 family protein [Novosphingobium sp. BL-8A]|uniref:DUF1348 family protein n=1 Tax=Novosphingobium sp. BL-8A TaxID=3127639 RepID=UPI0037576684